MSEKDSGFMDIRFPEGNLSFEVTGNPVFWKSLQKGKWESNCIRHLLRTVRPGDTVLDLGAWFGPYTLLFARLVGPAGKVYSFEPDDAARKILTENVQKNGLNNVEIVAMAVDSASGQSYLNVYEDWGDSMSSLLKIRDGGSSSRIVRTTTIDEFCRKHDICPDGIKIDVEGAEDRVLEGGRMTIQEYVPWVAVEFHGQFLSRPERLLNWYAVTKAARNITFLEGRSQRYRPGQEVTSIPDCSYCHLFMQY